MTTIAPRKVSIRHTLLDSPLGPLTVVRDDEAITGLYFPGHWTRPDRSSFGPRAATPAAGGFADVAAQLEEYFAGARQAFDLPLAIPGDETGRDLRRLLHAVPYGRTTTYGAVAADLGRGTDARESGALVARNPLAILVPCHRVVGATGALTGYAGGLRRKRHLLDLERSVVDADATLW